MAVISRPTTRPEKPLPHTIPKPDVHKLAFTVDEAAAAISVSRRQIYYLMKSGDLPYSQRGGRRLIRADALKALLN